jgi:hypothetical protein
VTWDNTQVKYWAVDYHGSRYEATSLAQGEKTVETTNIDQVIVGIGMSIDSSNVSDLGIKVLDLKTSRTSWIDADNRANAGDPGTYESVIDLTYYSPNTNGTIKELYVAVGVSGSAADKKCDGLGLFYQTLKFTASGDSVLQGNVGHDYTGGTEVAFKADTDGKTIILGVSARAQDSTLKNLYIKTAPLVKSASSS